MFRVVLSCGGIPTESGPEAAADITKEFVEHRPWHKNASCVWDGSRLVLAAVNDYDPDGQALLDEFSDCISAYVAGNFDSDIRVESVTRHDV
jgi:hypothetical protein